MHDIIATGILRAGGGGSDRLYPLGQNQWMADHWPQILWWIVPVVATIAAFYLWNAALRRKVERSTADLQASRAQTERQARRLLALVSHFPDAILFETAGREVKQTNQAFCNLFEIPAPPDTLLGADCRQTAEQARGLFVDADGFIPRIEDIIAARRPVLNEKLPMRNGRTLVRDYVPIESNGQVEHLWHYRDISESKQMEDALRQSETKYRRLVQNAPVGIITADTHGNVTSANPAVLALLGSPSEEATKAINVLTFPPLVKAGVSDAIRRCLAGESHVMEYPYRSAWDKEVFARLHLTPVRSDTGQIDGILGIIEDITDRRQAEDALRQNEQKYRELFGLFRAISDNMTDMLWAKNLNKEYIFVNQAICDQLLLATDTDEPLGKTDLFFADRERARHPDDPHWHTFGEICQDSDQVILDTQQPGQFDEFGNVQGKFLFLDVRKSPLFDENGTMIGVVGSARDVTAEKAMQEQLKQSEEKFRTLANEIPDGVSVTIDGKNYWVNNAFADIFGYTKEELIGQGADFVIVPEEVPRLLRQMRHRLAGETAPTQYETLAKRKDGKIINLDVSAQVIQFEGKQAIQVVVRDITTQKEMEQQLIQQERMAAVGQLTAGIAHDFNNILTSILGYAELIKLSPDTPAKFQPDLEQIITSGERAAHLVRQLLDFSRKSMRQPKRLDLADFTRKVVNFLKRTLPETIQINLDYPNNGDIMVEVDPAQLHQLLTNLAINAKDAMPTGGNLTMSVSRVEATAANCLICGKTVSGNWACLTVADTGQGISPDVLPHILEPFFTTRDVGQGTGLGLAQVSGIVSQNHGHLTVDSEPGQGTTVAVYLPPVTKPDAARNEMAGKDPSRPLRGQGQTVLLVEDNPTVREVNQTMLERLNYRALVAANGREALAIFDDHKDDIALVLSDMVMPDMGGEALFNQLKRQKPRIKMIIMSGYPLGEADIQSLLDAGVAAWVEKPLSLSRMAQIVGEVIPPKRNKGRWA